MKKLMLLLVVLCLPVLGWSQQALTIPVDAKTSLLRWTGHAEIGTYAPSGTLVLHDGTVTLREGQFAGATLNVDMRSLNQENAELTHHLKSADFFDVEKYPVTVIQIDKVAHGVATGTLTIKGKSAPFEAPVTVTAADQGFVVNGKVTLDRTRYGIVYNSTSFFSGLGNHAIRNHFEVEFTIAFAGRLPTTYKD